MDSLRSLILPLLVCALGAVPLVAQQPEPSGGVDGEVGLPAVEPAPGKPAASPAVGGASVLRLIRFNGAVRDALGAPYSGMSGITFALYAEQEGGAPLWVETQNVALDEQGRYTALLGMTSNEGLPLELFTTEEARWLGIRVQGELEQARVLLVSVPYALRAADAERLGGKPASAFALTEPAAGTGTESGEVPIDDPKALIDGSGTTNFLAKFTSSTNIGNSQLFDNGTNVGIGNTNPPDKLTVNGNLRLIGQTTHQVQMNGADSAGRLGQDLNGFFFASDTPGKLLSFFTNPGTGIQRVLRLEPPVASGNGTSPNVVAGHFANSVTPGVGGATIAGGGETTFGANSNRVTDDFGTVSGGKNNQAGNGTGTLSDASFATVGGGLFHTASGQHSTIGGGNFNLASGRSSTVAGGGDGSATLGNKATGDYSFVGGGFSNTASGLRSTVAGGASNTASGVMSFVAGSNNTASGNISTVPGGQLNTTSGFGATVPGGENNTAGGNYSLAAGLRAKALHQGAFVWGDSTDADISSSANNQFIARASGGFFFQSDSTLDNQGGFLNTSTGGFLSTGGTWTDASDAALKENFAAADPRAILARLAALPVQSWNYRAEGPGVKRLGPTAQDFYAAFGLGSDDKHISGVDAHGVAFAALQALDLASRQQEARLRELKTENDSLRSEMNQQGTNLTTIRRLLERQAAELARLKAMLERQEELAVARAEQN